MKAHSVIRVHRALMRRYGPIAETGRDDPLDVLVATILSQNTSDVNSTRAYAGLRWRFRSWAAVRRARCRAIAASIRVGGLAGIKARRIKEVLGIIVEREGRLSLTRLGRLADAEALEYLRSLPGVGMKTAACVLLFALGRPVMPVDTHVYRIARRLGWLAANVRPEGATAALARIVPPRLNLALHLHLIGHGRETCRPRNPACGGCCILDLCPLGMRRQRKLEPA